MAIITFSSAAFEAPVSNFDPLPPGEYLAMVTNSEIRDTKAGNGKYITVTMEIIDGKFSGRRIWENFNFINPNKVTVEICEKNMKQLSVACGFPFEDKDTDSDAWTNIPFTLVLDINSKDPTRNRVKGYQPSGSPSASSEPAASAKPWERK